MAEQPLVRRDIWALEDEQPWHPITEAYARGILVLQDRGEDDATSWAYQAAIHGLFSAAEDDKFRDECQHNSWYFLPWHRMYLYWFERTVRAALSDVPEVGDELKETWTLPYWDYERTEDSAALPPAFRDPELPDGTPNPLRVEARDPNINIGGKIPPLTRSSLAALGLPVFTGAAMEGGVGGPVTGWQHEPFNPPRSGGLEARPHNGVHGQVGGEGGFMSNFDDAPKDPVFWMHHANIDRLWAVWLRQEDREDPTDPAWTDFQFDFHDENGGELQQSPADVLDSIGQLGYTYENLSVPGELEEEPAPVPVLMSDSRRSDHPAELVGASDDEVKLQGRSRVTVNVAEPKSPGLLADRAAGRSPRVLLGIEGIEGEANPGLTYAVYVNLPDDADADTDPERHLAGELSFFGIERLGDLRRDHPEGAGQLHTFDITRVANELQEQGRWDADAITVTFEPIRVEPPPGAEDASRSAEERAPVKVGRVSVFLQ
jgi:tyrosinase